NPDQPVARHRLKNGDIRIVQIVFNPITFDERRAHLVLARDITRRQQAEQELLRSNQDYQAQHDALLELTRHAANPDNDERASLGAITEKVAAILRAGRVSIWRFNLDRSAIVCADLFVGPDAVHADGIELREADFPGYFRALATGDVIDADDARADPRTREFTDTYLDPLGITSMLDAPILVAGELAGVLCVEHIGPARRWTTPERTFTLSVPNLLSPTLPRQARARAPPRAREVPGPYVHPPGLTSRRHAPILVAGERAGVLCVEHIGPARRWTTPERTFAVSVANLLALTLAQQARTHSETRLRT